LKPKLLEYVSFQACQLANSFSQRFGFQRGFRNRARDVRGAELPHIWLGVTIRIPANIGGRHGGGMSCPRAEGERVPRVQFLRFGIVTLLAI
jgi:hypothetical protein